MAHGMCGRRITLFIFALVGVGRRCAAQTPASPGPPSPRAPSGWKVQIVGSERVRSEWWSWFAPTAGFDGSYGMWSSVLRLGAMAQSHLVDARVDLAQPWLAGVPESAVAAAPQGQLGFGGTYRAVNADRTTDVFVKQGFLRLKLGKPGHVTSLRLGRFEFSDGRETAPLNPTVAALKRDRLADRLIGSFTFPAVGRSFDGVEVTTPVARGLLTGLAVRPTQGVFNLDGMPELAVDLGYLSLTRPLFGRDVAGKSEAKGELRLFGLYYQDRRPGSTTNVKLDNRPLAIRAADAMPVEIFTVGGHYVSTHRLGAGQIDLLGWAALQTGSWGRLDHRAGAVAVESGYQLPLGRMRPWLRAGYYRSSGDPDPTDLTHRTFFGVVPTPRLYARFPFFNLMNVDDVFGQALVQPSPRLALRSDLHRLRLAEPNDLWYSGGGAFEKRTFGYAGRPSGGSRNLATLLDVSLDWRLFQRTRVNLYGAHAIGGNVVRALHPSGRRATYGYLELIQTL